MLAGRWWGAALWLLLVHCARAGQPVHKPARDRWLLLARGRGGDEMRVGATPGAVQGWAGSSCRWFRGVSCLEGGVKAPVELCRLGESTGGVCISVYDDGDDADRAMYLAAAFKHLLSVPCAGACHMPCDYSAAGVFHGWCVSSCLPGSMCITGWSVGHGSREVDIARLLQVSPRVMVLCARLVHVYCDLQDLGCLTGPADQGFCKIGSSGEQFCCRHQN